MFGQPAAGASPFGAPATSTPFGAAAPAFGTPAAAPTPAFGAPAPAAGGFAFGSPAPAPATSGFGGFGSATPAPAPTTGFGGFGSPAPAPVSAFGAPAAASTTPFGSPAPAPSGGLFGAAPTPAPATGGLFGAPAPAFGAPAPATSGFGGFGSAATPTPAPAFGASATGAFGSAAPAPATGGLFGSAPTPAPAFGVSAPAPAFGAPAPATGGLFGAPAPAPASGGLFGAPAAPVGGAAGQGVGSRVAPFQETRTQDGTNSISFQSVTAMPQYQEKSFEELRLEDYMAGNKGSQGQPVAAPVGGFGAPAPAPAMGGGLFGSTTPAPAPTSGFGFGAATPAPATGGLFGKPAAAPAAGGLFGAPAPAPATGGLFGSPAPAPAFGAPAPAAGGFNFGGGATPAPAPATGGLFGAPAAAPATGGLFGAPAAAPATGGLFGAPAAAPATGGLFGAPAAAPATGGLLGAPAAAPATGGLFGSPAAAPATGGLFGAPAAAPATGGLFGAPAAAPATGGLFGAPAAAPATGGLFGAPAAAPATGGLFGAPAAAPATGGLFGAPAPSAGGGLFGAKPATGGLFGAPSPAVPAPAVAGGFVSTNGGAGTGQTFLVPPAADQLLAQKMAAIQNQNKELEVLEAWRGGGPSPKKIGSNGKSNGKIIPTSVSQRDAAAVRYRGLAGSTKSTSPATNGSGSSGILNSYHGAPRSAVKVRPRGFGATKSSLGSFSGRSSKGMLSPSALLGSATKNLVIKPDALAPKPKTRLLLSDEAAASSEKKDTSTGESHAAATPIVDLIKGPRSLPNTGDTQTPTNGRKDQRDFENSIIATEKPGFASPEALQENTTSLSPQTKATPLPESSQKKKTATPVTPTDKSYDFYRSVIGSPSVATNGEGDGFSSTPTSGKKASELPLPSLTKEGYAMRPSLEALSKMGEADLAAVSNFIVDKAGVGSVAWKGAVDVRGIDLDSVVNIEPKTVDVYHAAEQSGTKPPVGTKLNRPAIITLHNIYSKNGPEASAEEKEKFERKIEKKTKQMNAKFILMDTDIGIWKFEVDHFSRYGLDDDSDDEEEDENINAAEEKMDFEEGVRGGR